MLLANAFQPTIVFADALRQRAYRLKHRAKRRPQRLGYMLGSLVVEAPGRALGQASPKGLHGSPNVVDQLRARTDQRLPGADDRQMSLGVLTAVFERIKQLRIQTCQASQILGVYLICFAPGGVDEPQFPSIGYQHLVAAVLEYPANPRRVGARLYGYAQRLVLLRGEALPEGLGDGTQPTLLDHFAAFGVQQAHMAVFVPKIYPERHR